MTISSRIRSGAGDSPASFKAAVPFVATRTRYDLCRISFTARMFDGASSTTSTIFFRHSGISAAVFIGFLQRASHGAPVACLLVPQSAANMAPTVHPALTDRPPQFGTAQGLPAE